MGTFTISFGGGQARAVYPPNIPPGNSSADPLAPTLSELRFVVTFTELGGAVLDPITFEGTESLQGSVPVGIYNITMDVYLLADDSLYATGSAIGNPVTIAKGPNPAIMFQLAQAPLSSGKDIIIMTLLSPPTAPSYQGLPPDLTGFSMQVTYNDGSTGVITDVSLFHGLALDVNGNTSRIVEQSIPSQTINIHPVSSSSGAFVSAAVTVVPIIIPGGLQVTGIVSRQYYPEDLPDFKGFTMEANYADGSKRVIPMTLEREQVWLYNQYYREDGTSNPRELIAPGYGIVSNEISYRVASNDVPIPTLAQALGDAPRDPAHPTGTEIFMTFPFDTFWSVMGLSVTGLGGPPGPYTNGTAVASYNWIDELKNAGITLEVTYSSGPPSFTPAPIRKTITMNEFALFMRTGPAVVLPNSIEINVVDASSSPVSVLTPGVAVQVTYRGHAVLIPLVVQ